MDDKLRLTRSEIETGRHALDALRAQLRHSRPVRSPPAPAPTERTPPPPVEPEMGMAQVHAELAWGAERDRLQARISELEADVAQLRRALAAIVHHAATAIAPTADHGPEPFL